jgi:hypothetical protein
VCDATSWGANEKVVNHVCTAGPAVKTSSGKHDASEINTLCDATMCSEHEKVVNHVCAACPPGKTSLGDHDASGSETTCEASICGPNEKVVNHVCVVCPAGKTSSSEVDASGTDTLCDATSCGAIEKVANHVCATCPARPAVADATRRNSLASVFNVQAGTLAETISAIRRFSITANVSTSMLFEGTVAAGDLLMGTPDCSSATPAVDPTHGSEATSVLIVRALWTYKLFYRANSLASVSTCRREPSLRPSAP